MDYKVIGRDAWKNYSKPEEMKTKGICGSGILDVLAELYSSGVIAKSGRFSKNQKVRPLQGKSRHQTAGICDRLGK